MNELLQTEIAFFEKQGEIKTSSLPRIFRSIEKNMSKSWSTVPHVTHFHDIDITSLEAYRSKNLIDGKPISLLIYVLKATANTLLKFERFRSSLLSDRKTLVEKQYIHLGIAVNTESGLIVPVIKNVDQKTIYELANELQRLTKQARNSELSMEDIQGACFTVSNLGGAGGEYFTPIVNNPETAIMGLGRSKIKPVWHNTEFIPRVMLPLSLSYDHRLINGVDAVKFINHFVDELEKFPQ